MPMLFVGINRQRRVNFEYCKENDVVYFSARNSGGAYFGWLFLLAGADGYDRRGRNTSSVTH